MYEVIADSFNKDPLNDEDIDYTKYALKGCIDFAPDDPDTERTEATYVDLDATVSEPLDNEVMTIDLLVFKVDIRRKKLIELRDIGDHALVLGFNASICIPTTNLSPFEPNCAYLTDDYGEHSHTLWSDRGIWNIKKRSMKKLEDVCPNLHSCLALPEPIWIRPRF
jgi:hypothetical protein